MLTTYFFVNSFSRTASRSAEASVLTLSDAAKKHSTAKTYLPLRRLTERMHRAQQCPALQYFACGPSHIRTYYVPSTVHP